MDNVTKVRLTKTYEIGRSVRFKGDIFYVSKERYVERSNNEFILMSDVFDSDGCHIEQIHGVLSELSMLFEIVEEVEG